MRIAILTLPLHTNYGGILQAYALQTVLQRMGHEVCVLSYLPCFCCRKKVKKIKIIVNYKVKKLFKQLPKTLLKLYYIDISKSTNRYLNLFIKLHINEYYIADLNKIKQNMFDCFVVGSDQIWRPAYNGEIENSFLSFTKGWCVKRLAYAPSFGTDKWEYSKGQTIKCKELLSKFHSVSVRELSGKNLCKEKFNIDAELVLDPTLLLDKEDYIRLFEAKEVAKSGGNLMVYLLDESDFVEDLVKLICKNKGLKPFKINFKKKELLDVPLKERIQQPLENWLRGFYDAEFIITDSFHACVFSLIFNKPFAVTKNNSRGNTRIDSLLKIFNQEYRIIDNDKIFESSLDKLCGLPNAEIQIENFRKKSFEFLQKSLKSQI